MKQKTNNKKNLLYFTLAVGLVAGIWKMSASSSQDYVAPKGEKLSGKTTDIDLDKKTKTNTKKSVLKATSIDPDKKTKTNTKKSALKTVKKIESKSKTTSGQDTISSLRDSFDVTDPDQVRKVQNILGLDEDGIFGPKTKLAWEAAIAKDDKNNINVKNISIASTSKTSNPQPQDEKTIAKGKQTLTTSISTKAKDPNSNAMLE